MTSEFHTITGDDWKRSLRDARSQKNLISEKIKQIMKNNYINHIALVLDDSASMGRLKRKAIEVIDQQVENLKDQARKSRQETRLSIYTFGQRIDNICFDVALDKAPSAVDYYKADQHYTALIDGTTKAIKELLSISTIHGDHAFLLTAITDGMENVRPYEGPNLRALIDGLNGDWTVSAVVPNLHGKSLAQEYGFPRGNIQIWETTESGLEELGDTYTMATASYMTSRSLGLKSTKNLFDLKEVSKTAVKEKLEQVNPADYRTLLVRKADDGKAIKDFTEYWTKEPYRVGSSYYQLTKAEKIQAGKSVAVLEKATGRLYSGVNARKLLGLPGYEVKAAPADFPLFDVFVQSTSTNRKLVKDTSLIVFN